MEFGLFKMISFSAFFLSLQIYRKNRSQLLLTAQKQEGANKKANLQTILRVNQVLEFWVSFSHI